MDEMKEEMMTEEEFNKMKQEVLEKIEDIKYGERVIVMIAHKSPYNIIRKEEVGVAMKIDVSSMGCNIDELAMALVSVQMRPEVMMSTIKILTSVKSIEDAEPDDIFGNGER